MLCGPNISSKIVDARVLGLELRHSLRRERYRRSVVDFRPLGDVALLDSRALQRLGENVGVVLSARNV